MNKSAYIKELEKRLKYIPKEDREDAVAYYTELMDDMGLDETEDVEGRLGSAKDAAKKIIDDATDRHIEAYEEKKSVKGHATVVWLSILGVLSLPVSLPLAAVVLSLAVTLVVVFIAILISLAAAAIGLFVGGLCCLVVMFLAPGFTQKLVVFGTGLAGIAIGGLLGYGVFALVRLLIRVIFRRGKSHGAETAQNASAETAPKAAEETVAEAEAEVAEETVAEAEAEVVEETEAESLQKEA
ncbi:MAG: DUF1700 domain-containing protein [Lachnospiraceae bacterium]|nr:DUF1700 domain-containing protein [Lachnospiraceae bacterium]